MKAFTSVEEWLKTTPSSVEVSKVLTVINKVVVRQSREDLYKLEQRLRKLNRSLILLTESKIKCPKELTDEVANSKKMIAELKKQLPPKKVVRRKTTTTVVTEPAKDETTEPQSEVTA